ncbi:MAG: sulfatase-like hydrolase/transferase [Defluviitaleaceae bacterium]|nr:sulfatase-like hydrolase/transferase [Defluviitaleaceae bacterium]
MRILYLDIDTLRPDHMGCYGYSRNTTPNLDRIAAEGFVFDNYYTSDAPCLPSRAALNSGRFGIHTGIVGHGGTAADRRIMGPQRDFQDQSERDNLFYTLRKANLYTASISSFAERHSAWWWNAGLNESYNVGGAGHESGEEVLPIALDWLDRNQGREDWFLHLHVWDPHTPYRAPAGFGNPFENEPLHKPWITEEIFAEHFKQPGPHTAQDLHGMHGNANPHYPRYPGSLQSVADVKTFIDNYDTGILYADTILGQVIDRLKAQGIYDDTAIIISSDHGENMGEMGLYAEHGTADEITCHIPMIVKWPGAAPGRDAGFRYNVDLIPTLAELLDTPKSHRWDGESFAQRLMGHKDANPGRQSLVLSQQAHICQRSARFGEWIYIRTIRDGWRLFDDEMLFNLKDDPREQFNVAKAHPEICAQGAKIILTWQEDMMKTSDSDRDPMWTVYREGGPHHAPVKLTEAYAQRLEASNRAESAEKLRRRYGLK